MALITRNSVLRRTAEPRLEILRLRISIWPDWYGGASMPAKATSAFLEWKRRTSPISAISWGAECGANSEHPHHNGVLRQRCRQGLHFIPERGQRSGSGLELGYRLFHQNLCSIVLWHDAEVPAGRGVNVQRLVLTEVIAMPLTPFLVFGCKCLFGQLANTLTMPRQK